LCEKLALDLQRKGYLCKTVGVKVKYTDFKTATRDITLDEPIADAADLRAAAGKALARMPLTQRIRLLGVRASHLVPLKESQIAQG
jgi:DNA polymerase-4